MLNSIVIVIAIVSGLINLTLAGIRLAECIYQLRQKPELDTLGKIIQVFKNFFVIETYVK